MSTILDKNRRAHRDPAHVAYWRHATETEPTALVRDILGQDAAAPTATVTASLPEDALVAATRITQDDPTLLRVLYAAVLALVTARATDTERVTIVVAAPADAADPAVPLTVPVTRTATFRELLVATRAAYLDVAAHTGAPFQLFYEQAGVTPTDVALGLRDDLPASDHSVHFGLDGDRLTLTYRTDRFTAATADRLAADFTRLSAAVLADVDAPVGPLADADERDLARIAAFNDTAAEFPATTLLHQFLEQAAREHPDRVAIADDGTTYAAFNTRANRLAHRLRALGVAPGEIVGVCLPRSPAELVAIYAVLKAGGAYLPVDPTLPRNRIDYLVEHSGTRIVLGDDRDVLPAGITFVDLSTEDASGDDTDPEVVTGPRDLCYVIYTSGSTGRPKGVMIEHQAIVNRLNWMQRAYPVAEGDVILHKTPFTFDVSVWEIFWWSVAGAAVATLPAGDERDPARIVARITEHRVTTLHFVPSMLKAFLAYADGVELATLRQVFASGEALGTAQAVRFARVLGHARLVNLYGPTEAAVDVTSFDCAGAEPDRPVPIGTPIDNLALRVLTTAGTLAPIGTPGELCLTGVGLARGYLNAPELTEERFVADPLRPGERMYRTGDLARWSPDGVVEYLGRIDTQVKIRGYRIELGEIEHVAARVAGVRECAVAAIPVSDGDRALCAYVVAGEGFAADAFRTALAAELPAYMVPQWTVVVESIPTNHNGKRDLATLPRPDRDAGPEYVAPDTDVERLLCEIFANVLDEPRVGVRDDFFALGGDSIKAISVLVAARAAGLELTFQELFANPTVTALAELVVERDDATGEPELAPFALLSDADRARVPDGAVDAYPLSSLQTGLLYEAARSAPGSGLYHDILSYDVAGTVDVELFRRAVGAVANRHPVVRTSFHLTGFTEAVQLVHERVPNPLTVFDLGQYTADEQDARLREFAALDLARGFRPGEPDLVRVYLHLLGDRGYRYTLSYHDAALDGWSVNTIHRDIFEAYFTLLDGDEPAAVWPAVGYGDFVRLERDAVRSAESGRFWADVLASHDDTRLPRLDRRDGPVEVVLHDVPLPDDVAAGIVRTAAALRVPVKSVLLAAHVAVLSFVSGTASVRTGYEHSGRPEVFGGDLIAGLFLNTVPFGVRYAGGTWAELVREVYRTETELLPHRRFPMQAMKRAAGTRAPLFDSVFNFTHFHVLKDLSARDGFGMVRSVVNAQTEFPFRAEFAQDAITDRVELALHYHATEFDADHITRIGGYYARALELIATAPDTDRHATTLLGADELASLTVDFAGPHRELPDATFVDLFAERARTHPDATALVHRDERLTYRRLDEAAARMAAHLAAGGVGRGDVVTTLLPRGIDWAVTVLGLLKLGAVYLPQDAGYPAERLSAVLRRSGCRHVVAEGPWAGLDGVTVLNPRPVGPAAEPTERPRPDDPAYLIFTSGSTGEPKGALIHHGGMLNHLRAKVFDLGLSERDRIAQVATQCFDISVWQLLTAWLVGGTTVLVDQDTVTDIPALLGTTAEQGVTVLEVVPSYLDAMLAELERRPVPLPALRYLMVTGEALPPGLTHRWFARHCAPMVNAYGPTETADDVTHHVLTSPAEGERVPIGRAVPNTGLYVVDSADRLRPTGSYGEIVVTGTGVGLGYVNDPQRTAAAFRPNVLDDRSASMYRTGDVGRWLPGGVLDCAGRLDHQVKVRGFRIELSEIEGRLGRLPGVDHAVVVVRDARLAAFYTGARDWDLADVRTALATWLPAYMHPDSVTRLTVFPLTGNGKVDRSALARQVPALVGRPHEAPRDDLERRLVELFATVLDLDPAEVGASDNFFDIGGHSIAALKVVVGLDGAITLPDLLSRPSARALADRMREQRKVRRDLLVDLTAAAGLDVAMPTLTVVCVPFAGGGAVSYVPVARALHGAGVRVLGVELPARTRTDERAPVPAEQLGSELADELATRVSTPVTLLGHCAGAGVALSTAYALRRKGVDVRQLVVVAKLLRSADPADHEHNEVVHMSEAEILQWLKDNTGFAEPGSADLANAFRYDTAEASRAFANALRSGPLDVPVTAVLAEDDPLAQDHDRHVARWARFGPLTVVTTLTGGHYLNVTEPQLLAACVTRNREDTP